MDQAVENCYHKTLKDAIHFYFNPNFVIQIQKD